MTNLDKVLKRVDAARYALESNGEMVMLDPYEELAELVPKLAEALKASAGYHKKVVDRQYANAEANAEVALAEIESILAEVGE